MRNRTWQPLTLVWVVALTMAALLGFVIGGNPMVAKDVPLRDRKVTTTTTSAPVAASPLGTAPVAASPPSTGPTSTAPSATGSGQDDSGSSPAANGSTSGSP